MAFLGHLTVLKNEAVEFLTEKVEGEGLIADCTFGGGGHSFAFLEKNPELNIIGFDQDPDSYENGQELIKNTEKIKLIFSNFVHFKEKIESECKEYLEKFGGFDGILIDLGVSSHQFDSDTRGFSFRFDSPLDMRMNPTSDTMTAADVLNTFEEEEIANIIFNYGEERFSRKIAKKIVEFRLEKKFETTKELENLVFHCYPKEKRFKGIHPATRTFQALRIYVNDELGVVEKVIPDLFSLLKTNGRIAIISFHSLEDRIVKHSFKKLAKEENGKILTKKPILPTKEEILNNSRSRSAKMRVIEKECQDGKSKWKK